MAFLSRLRFPMTFKTILEKIPRLNVTGLLSSKNPELEMNLFCYGVGVLVCAVVLWRWESTGPRDGNLVAAMTVFLGAITGGLFKKGSNANQPTAGPGTPDQGGK